MPVAVFDRRRDSCTGVQVGSTEELEAVRHAAAGVVPEIENFALLKARLLTAVHLVARVGDRHLRADDSISGLRSAGSIQPEWSGSVWETIK